MERVVTETRITRTEVMISEAELERILRDELVVGSLATDFAVRYDAGRLFVKYVVTTVIDAA